MASRIITKKGSGAPLASDLVHGELAVDTVNKRLYTENAGGTVIEVGTAPSTIDINAGTIDGTVIGGSTAAAGTFTTGQFNTSLNVDGTVTADDVVLNGTQPNDVSIQLTTSGDGWTIGTEYNANNDIDLVVKGGNAGSAFTEYLRITDSGDIDVTGTVTADGLTVDGDGSFSGTVPRLTLFETDLTDGNAQFLLQTRELRLGSVTDAGASFTDRFKVNVATGDISFYEDTGTTAKFFWDASAEFLGIGTDTQTTNGESLRLINGLFINTTGTSSVPSIAIGDSNSGLFAPSAGSIAIATQGGQRLTVDDSGNILFGATSTSATEYGAKVLKDGSVSEIFAVHRQATDGDFIQFARGGNTIGSIGCGSGALTFDNSSGEAMRIDSSGHLIVPEGITLGTAVGTYNAANTLDDYEEGTWTPTVSESTAGTSPSSVSGNYTKIGNTVFINGTVYWTETNSWAVNDHLEVQSLPFAISSFGGATGYVNRTYPNSSSQFVGYLGASSFRLICVNADAGRYSDGVLFSGYYFTDS